MAEQLQFRQGTTVQHSTFTGAVAEITIDTDKDVAVVHDGATVGGHPLAKQSSVDLKANDNAVVKLTGDQTVDGIKTHTSIPVVPAVSPTTDNQVTRKKYVDDGLALKTGIGTATPLAPAVTAVVGVSTNASRQDHVHPTNFTATATDIKMDGVQAVGTLTTYPRADHVHPSDTSKANLASPTLTGTPLSTTAAVGTNTTQIATTAFVNAEIANDTYVKDTANWRDTMMSKAEFNAIAAERRANRAGSGFDEWGKHYLTNVNDGMFTSASYINQFRIGRYLVDGIGTSKTPYPIASINGVLYNILSINSTSATSFDNIFLLPPAPTVLPSTATLTQQQIDSGVIKHADTSNSGLLLNGKFDTDTSGWTAVGGTIAVVANKLQITNGTSTEGQAYQAYTTVIGKKYTLEINNEDGTSLTNAIRVGTAINGSTLINLSNITSATRTQVDFIATATTTYLTTATGSTVTGETVLFDNIAVFPADAISRSDLVFLESWHEDVSEKDFVYPIGNVMYLGTTGDCGTTVAGAFAGYGTYSLLSDTWQADSALVGKGYVWSTLSDANKKAFVANHENNCYLDGDKVIQVRYRARVVMGLGDSGWFQQFITGYTSNIWGTTHQLGAKGKNTTMFDLTTTVMPSRYVNSYFGGLLSGSNGIWNEVAETGSSYVGTLTTAIPIALVHRRNQGMMHPVYNPNGTKLASDSLPWYSTTVSFTSIADCFTDSKLLATSGYIGTTTGRSDGIFYDQVSEMDITDLRNNSAKVQDYDRLIDKEFNKLVAGTYRGTEGESFAYLTTDRLSSSAVYIYADGSLAIYNIISEANLPTSGSYTIQVFYKDTLYTVNGTINASALMVSNASALSLAIVADFGALNAYVTYGTMRSTGRLFLPLTAGSGYSKALIATTKSTRTKSNTLTHTDIIGSPANYPTTWKQSGVSGTPLIVAEDGTSLLPTGTTGSDGLAVYKLSRKANAAPLQVLKSTDSGATWTALTVTTHYTFSTTTNAITFTAGNIPLVAHLIMVTYQTHTNMAVAAVNSEVLAIGDVWAGNYFDLNTSISAWAICPSLIGKVAIAPASGNIFSKKSVIAPIHAQNLLGSVWTTVPQHEQITLTNNSPTVKVFPYLTRSNGKAWLVLVFKEMKYGSYAAPTTVTAASATYTINMTYKINIAGCALDGKVIQWTASTTTVAVDWSLYDVSPTGVIYLLSSGAVYANARLYDGDSWGDDSKFNIVDNVSTTTDTNGATVLIGQKRIELPYFIGAAE